MSPLGPRTGEVRQRPDKDGRPRFFVRVRITADVRPEVRLWAAKDRADAERLATWIAGLVELLVESGREAQCAQVVKKAAAAKTDRGRKNVDALVRGICEGVYLPTSVVFRDFAARWTSGELAKIYPDHVKQKDHGDDKSRLRDYINPILGDVPFSALEPAAGGLSHCERVMSKLPEQLSQATRRHVAQILHRVLELAVYPAKLLSASPLPKGFVPKLTKRIAKVYVYPDEDRRLLGAKALPELERLACGVLGREGMRVSELLDSDWVDWDLERGTFTLDANKTDDPRVWVLRADVVRALKIWRRVRANVDRPFAGLRKERLAKWLRDSLKASGVARDELYRSSENRMALRAHDLRATFVTLSLANGRTEQWIADRTGHKSSTMIQRYARTARTAQELGLPELGDLCEALGWVEAGPHVPPCDGAPECRCAEFAAARAAAAKTPAGVPLSPPEWHAGAEAVLVHTETLPAQIDAFTVEAHIEALTEPTDVDVAAKAPDSDRPAEAPAELAGAAGVVQEDSAARERTFRGQPITGAFQRPRQAPLSSSGPNAPAALAGATETRPDEAGRLVWTCEGCGIEEPAEEPYAAGDHEPCIYCDRTARVVRVGGGAGGDGETASESPAASVENDAEARMGLEPTCNGFAIRENVAPRRPTSHFAADHDVGRRPAPQSASQPPTPEASEMRPEASPARPLCAACGGRDPVPGGAATYCRACGGYAAAHTSTGFADLIPPPGRHGFHAPAEPPPWVREQLTDDEVYFYDPLAGAHFGVRDGDWEEWRNVREIKPRNGVFPLGGKSDFCLTCGADVAPGEHTCAACVGVRPCRSCGGRGSQPLFGYAGQRASAQCRACRGTGRQRTSAATTPSIIDVDDARAIGVLEGLALARGIEVTP